MKHPKDIPLVRTIKERCRVCYTCVRECPAKAIRIADGQAEVLGERCIGCGNCVRVCSQHAKSVLNSIDPVVDLLRGPAKVVACVAPSFPAEFTDCTTPQLAGMIRALGFWKVVEVSFGADLVARRYRQLLQESKDQRYIATSCPALVAYVERYYPDLVPHLAPIVSPMIAMARVMRRLHGQDVKVVFIGPCIAKKGECVSEEVAGETDAALTFAELRQMFHDRDLTPLNVMPSDFDGPRGGRGSLFSLSRGMLQAADLSEDLTAGEIVATDGRRNFMEAIKEFDEGHLDARLLEVLCCEGCIMGAGMTGETPIFSRRSRVSRYVRQRLATMDNDRWKADMESVEDLDMGRRYFPYDQRIPVPFKEELGMIMAAMGKFTPEDELNCGACGYDTCQEHAMAIFKGLAENKMCLPFTIEQLKKTVQELAVSNDQLASTQAALMHSEKLASMGQLAAGIAHEVNNPLGIVLMYAHLLLQETQKYPQIKEDLTMIAEQADRCKKIVAGLLHFARQNKVVLQQTDLRKLVKQAMKAMPMPQNVNAVIEHDLGPDPLADVDRDQIVQVLTNLVSNALAAMPEGGTLTIRTVGGEDFVELAVIDTGVGIPRENLSKIFEPFFTTKQIGLGTGLGLAVTYGIVKMHRGDIRVQSNADAAAGPTGTTFTVTLPRHGQQD
jgi:iron only hydrogenase large subunit-like protein/nitrogen-specific signal transduction histidine kinase